jgi:rhodanese-related sulfurtransferase
MKLVSVCSRVLPPILATIAWGTAVAEPPIPITAEDAFEAVQMQIDPTTQFDANVVLVDVRDPLEIFSSGAAGAVREIMLTSDELIEPDLGRVSLIYDDENMEYALEYDLLEVLQRTPVSDVENVVIEPIAINVTFWRRTESGWKTNAKNFYPVIRRLARDFNVLILYCRTGGRSSLAGDGVDPELFDAVYEIDDPTGQNNGLGGFTGSNYANAYNGYAGFPMRLTTPISWVDSGLPVIREAKALP